MKNKVRQGKKQQFQGKKEDKSFSIFNNNHKSNGQPKPERTRKHSPLITKEQRNQILRSLNNGEEIEIKC